MSQNPILNATISSSDPNLKGFQSINLGAMDSNRDDKFPNFGMPMVPICGYGPQITQLGRLMLSIYGAVDPNVGVWCC